MTNPASNEKTRLTPKEAAFLMNSCDLKEGQAMSAEDARQLEEIYRDLEAEGFWDRMNRETMSAIDADTEWQSRWTKRKLNFHDE